MTEHFFMAPAVISATKAKHSFGKLMSKVKEGSPLIIEKNDTPQIVWISIDDYEDFLELKDSKFQKSLARSRKEIEKGKSGTLDSLYAIHRKTIEKEAD